MSDKELLPCPFCGGEAAALLSDSSDARWRIWCLRPTAVCGLIGPYKDTEAAATTAWNRRASDPLTALLAETYIK